MTRSRPIALRAALALGSTLAGQSARAAVPTPPPRPADSRAVGDAEADGPRRTADQLLKALRRSKPIRDLVAPASGIHDASKTKTQRLLPEGTAVVDWEGYLIKNASWWTLITESPTGEPPTKVLPNINLEIMARSMFGKSAPIRFSVSGEMTTFQDENFLLTRFVRRIVPTPDVEPPNPVSATPAIDNARDSIAAPTPSAEDVIAALRRRSPRSMIPAPVRRAVLRPAGFLPGPTVRPDGTAFAQRPGRITREDRWWNFAFETDHPDAEEPMIKLLPSRGLDLMIRMAEETPDGLVLLVTGELTQFGGENYLLPRGVLRRSATDNLRK